MNTLDTYIKEKLEEFKKKYKKFSVEGDHSEFTEGIFVPDVEVLYDFLESLIRQTARETVEEQKAKDELVFRIFKSVGCIEWKKYIDSNGYGKMRLSSPRANEGAHRVSYKTFVGEIPAGMVLDHLCRNRACINPAHLEVVTQRENTLRGIGPTAKHAMATHCPRGHPFDEKNTYVLTGKKRGRHCRLCHNAETRVRKAKIRTAILVSAKEKGILT